MKHVITSDRTVRTVRITLDWEGEKAPDLNITRLWDRQVRTIRPAYVRVEVKDNGVGVEIAVLVTGRRILKGGGLSQNEFAVTFRPDDSLDLDLNQAPQWLHDLVEDVLGDTAEVTAS